jgi:hypothetical protein
MVVIYPTEFIYQIRSTFIDEKQDDIVNILEYVIFYMFWGGVYHSPYYVSKHGYFYNFYGYVVILILLIFEKNGQLWSLDRFGCTQELQAHFKEVEDNFNNLKLTKSMRKQKTIQKPAIPDQIIQEEEKENDSLSGGRMSPSNRMIVGKSIEGFKYSHRSISQSSIFDRSSPNSKALINVQSELTKE